MVVHDIHGVSGKAALAAEVLSPVIPVLTTVLTNMFSYVEFINHILKDVVNFIKYEVVLLFFNKKQDKIIKRILLVH